MQGMIKVVGGKVSCLFSTQAAYIGMGAGISQKDPAIAGVEVAYALDEFVSVSPILRAIHERKLRPEIYIWNERLPEPDVAILFRLPKPSPSFLVECFKAGQKDIARALAEVKCEEVIAIAEANIPGAGGVSLFLELFSRTGGAGIVVREAGEEGLIDPETSIGFSTNEVYRKRPDLSD